MVLLTSLPPRSSAGSAIGRNPQSAARTLQCVAKDTERVDKKLSQE